MSRHTTSDTPPTIPPGYKQTDLGIIPEEWGVRRLGEIGTFLKGRGIKRDQVSDDGVYCIRYGEIYTHYNEYVKTPFSRIPFALTNSALPITQGAILFAGSGETAAEIGKCVAYLGTDAAYVGGDVIVLNPVAQNSLYLGYLLNYDSVAKQKARLGQGDAIVHIKISNLTEIKIPLPPLPEQRAIAAVLSDVDELLRALSSLIAKKRAIKQATMQQLLTGTTRLPGFSGEWATKRLGEVITFLSHANNPRSDLGIDGDVEYIHYGDIHAHTSPILDCRQVNLPRIHSTHIGNVKKLEDGDLVFVDASEDLEGTGKSVEVQGITDRHVIAGLHTIPCRGTTGHWAPGFKAYLQFNPTFKTALTRVATGISVYAISKKHLADIEIALPPVPEQRAIAAVLTDMDEEIAAMEREREKTQAIKQGMMQQLLTGRVRLVRPETGGEEQ